MAQRAALHNAAHSSQPAVLSQLCSLCPGAAALLQALVPFPCPLQPAQQQQGPGGCEWQCWRWAACCTCPLHGQKHPLRVRRSDPNFQLLLLNYLGTSK